MQNIIVYALLKRQLKKYGMEDYIPRYGELLQYQVGDYVVYKGKIYKALNATAGGAFVPSDWQRLTIAQALKYLQSQIDIMRSLGKFLSYWDCSTGLPESNPASQLPYTYSTGDYYRVTTVAEAGGTNYIPSGASYDGTPSTTVDEDVEVDMIFQYDGTVWLGFKNAYEFLKNYYTKAQADALFIKKVADAVSGNLVTLNEDGEAVDSGKAFADIISNDATKIPTAQAVYNSFYTSGNGYSRDMRGSNLNDMTHAGVYYGNSLTNGPEGMNNGFLIVVPHFDGGTFLSQIFIPINYDRFYYRRQNGSWSNWIRVANLSDVQAKPSAATSGNLAKFDGNKQTIDSGYSLNAVSGDASAVQLKNGANNVYPAERPWTLIWGNPNTDVGFGAQTILTADELSGYKEIRIAWRLQTGTGATALCYDDMPLDWDNGTFKYLVSGVDGYPSYRRLYFNPTTGLGVQTGYTRTFNGDTTLVLPVKIYAR